MNKKFFLHPHFVYKQLKAVKMFKGWCFLVTCLFASVFAAEDEKKFPTIVKLHHIDVGLEHVTVMWSYKGDQSGDFYNELVYKVYDTATQRVPHTKITDKGVNTFTITGLRSGTTYDIQVHTKTQDEDGLWSTSLLATTTGVRPPRTFYVGEITDTTTTVRWTPPITGDKPDDYLLTLRNNDNKEAVVYPALAYPATEYVLWHLNDSTPYTVFINARKNEEKSTNMSMGFRTDSALVVEARVEQIKETSVLVRWDTQEQRILIARYDVEIKDTTIQDDKKSRKTYESTGNQELRQLLIKDLKPDNLYSYRVRSVYRRNGGRGLWSNNQYFTTKAAAPPTKPLQGDVTTKALASIVYTWSPPIDVAQYTLREYEVQYAEFTDRPEPVIPTGDNTASYLLGGLESGTDYSIRVRAVTKHDTKGDWSEWSIFQTAGPKTVSSISLTEIKTTSVVIGWTLYTKTTADKIKITIIENSDISTQSTRTTQMVDGKKKRFVANDLRPFTPYAIEVSVILNNVESSIKRHGLRTSSTIDILSQQPTHPKIADREESQPLDVLYFDFDKIPNSIVRHYVVRVQGFDVPNIPFSRTQVVVPSIGGVRQRSTINDIVSGYKYKVMAAGVFYDNSTSKWSTAASTIVPGPRPVRALGMKRITQSDVTVSWKSGYHNGDDLYSKQEFVITLSQFGENSEENVLKEIAVYTAHAEQTEYKFESALDPLRRYQVQIVTKVTSLSQKHSTPKTRGFRADSETPEAPIIQSVVPDREAASVTFGWERVVGRNDIAYYEIEFEAISDVSPQTNKTDSGVTDSYSFHHLDIQKTYIFKIRAVDTTGEKSEWETAATNFKNDLTDVVEQIRTKEISKHEAILTWKAPTNFNLKKYKIELRAKSKDISITIITKGLTNQFKMEDLHAGTDYQYRVQAIGKDENKKGPWSNFHYFKTEQASSSSTFNKGIIAGIAVGGLVLIILIAVIVMTCKKRAKKSGRPIGFSRRDDGIKQIA